MKKVSIFDPSILSYNLGNEIISNSINKFISENFYENKLLTDISAENRKVNYPKNFFINNDGIHTILMDHTDCSQTSEAEFKKIDEIDGGTYK